MDKHQHIGINPSLPCQDRFAEEVGSDQRFHMGIKKQLPVARRRSPTLSRNGMLTCAFKDIAYRGQPDPDAQFLKLAM